jgi:hypothetical protein
MRMDQAQDTNARFDGVWPEWQGPACATIPLSIRLP